MDDDDWANSAEMDALMAAVSGSTPARIEIDLAAMSVSAGALRFAFTLAERHRTMFRQGLDMIGATLAQSSQIAAFARRHGVAVSEYLAARSVAGCTGENIVGGCDELTRGRVRSRARIYA